MSSARRLQRQEIAELADAQPFACPGAPEHGGGPEDRGERKDALEPWSERRLEHARTLEGTLARCYVHLARREHSVAELRARLERERLPPPAISEALAIVADQGYLDDARYARLLIEDRRAVGWGAARIRARLEAAGIAGELIDELTAGFGTASEVTAALAVIRRRCELPLHGDRERRRAFGILVQRGFDADVAYDAIRACGGPSDDAPSAD